MTGSSPKAARRSDGRNSRRLSSLESSVVQIQAQIEALWGPVGFSASDKRLETRIALGTAVIEGAGTAVKAVATDGFATPGDGGGGLYRYVGSEPLHPGKAQSEDGAWWELVPLGGLISPLAFGALADNATDDAQALQKAADAANELGAGLQLPAGRTVYLAGAVDLKGLAYIDCRSHIRVDPGISAVPITIGGFASGGVVDIAFADVTDGSSPLTDPEPTRPILRASGLKGGTVRIGRCNYLQVYADATYRSTSGTAYTRFLIEGAHRLLEITDSGAETSWVNENVFHISRIKRLQIAGVSYSHNHNKFYEPTLEGPDMLLSLRRCRYNQVYGARFEGTSDATGVFFDSDTVSNTVTYTWSNTGYPRSQFTRKVPVNDNGMGNMVTSEAATMFRKVPLWSLTPATPIVGSDSDSTAQPSAVQPADFAHRSRAIFTPSLGGIGISALGWIGLSEIVPVEFGDTFVWDADYEGDLVRGAIFLFDRDRRPIASERQGGAYVSSPGMSWATAGGFGFYEHGSDRSAHDLNESGISIIRSEVKFVRIGAYSTSPIFIRGLSCALYTQALGRGISEAAAQQNSAISLHGTPTKGFMPFGAMVYNHELQVWHRCSYRHLTTLDGAERRGATAIKVLHLSSVAPGDVIGILLDSGETHWTKVSQISGANVMLASALPGAATDGSLVAVNRWA